MEANIKDLDILEEYKKYVYLSNRKKIYKVSKMTIMIDHKIRSKFDNNIATKSEYNAYICLSGFQKKVALIYAFIPRFTKYFGEKNVKSVKYSTKYNDYKLIINPSVSYDNPKKVHKRDLIGYNGSILDNGGRVSHTHVNIYSSISNLFRRSKRYNPNITQVDGESSTHFKAREIKKLKFLKQLYFQ
ncbi:hypothetical protein [Candidatus Mycoplasma mahonii]|uniref:hypothetical protein n=1 Tax=Candidatus Mycoplasma mahonii TaxID=3004105 RepID=UPI0026E9E847|nr:hypothetical protein [Candidatus Mycoplasma mahonii]WKX02450.1 hypothetical protein O3I44_03605 [Candidatus Mycoplasma mahonii]